jgi:predicted regulator of Ras-like GTPase activity (Roadblock/LC7/MglB family)
VRHFPTPRCYIIRMPKPRTVPIDLTCLVDELVDRVDGVRHALVLSADGLAVAASAGLDRDDAEHIAASAAGLNGLARGVGRHLDNGTVLRTAIELDSGFLFVTSAGTGACLAVLCEAGVDVGLAAYEIERLAVRVERDAALAAGPTRLVPVQRRPAAGTLTRRAGSRVS